MRPFEPFRRFIHHRTGSQLHPIAPSSSAMWGIACQPWVAIGGGLAVLLLGAGVAIALPPRNSPPRVLPAPDPQLVYSVSGCEDVSLPPERVMAQNGAIAPPCAKITSANNWPTSDLAFLGRDPVRNVAIGFENDRLTFSHDLTFTCCASFVLDRSIDRSVYPPVISIVERDMGERCRCLCDFQVAGTIGPLPPGSYVVRVYGEFGDGKSRILLFERSASVPHGLLDPPATGSPQPARR